MKKSTKQRCAAATLLVTIISASPGSAAGPSESAAVRLDDAAIRQLLLQGDAARGEKTAQGTKAKCTRCHGDAGVSDEEDMPNIAGQIATYLYKQLIDYRYRDRENRAMRNRVKKLTELDLADISVYYAGLNNGVASTHKAKLAAPGLVTRGDLKRDIAGCVTCHGDSGKGRTPDVPALAGQKGLYLIETLMEFQDGERNNDPSGQMQAIAKELTEKEIQAVAEYYASFSDGG